MSTSANGQEVRSPEGVPGWLGGGRIPSLDGLRALAILLVIYSHARFPFDDLLPLRALKGRCGFLGVQLFFVLSGFLITTLMLREVHRTGRLRLGHFYLRRVLRIVPAYASYLAVLLVLQACGRVSLDGRKWLALATYTVNFLPSLPGLISHIWSLSVEEHFYFLWPLLMATGTLARCRRVALGCVAGALGLRWLVLVAFPGWGRGVDLWTFTRIDDIAVGCLLAMLARDPAWRGRLDAFTSRGTWMGLLLGVFLGAQVCGSRLLGSRLLPPLPLGLLIGLTNDVNSLTIGLLLWSATRAGGAGGRLLNHRALVAVGIISYSLYLWHPLFCEREPALLCAFPLNVVCMFLVGGLSYFLIEKPFLAMKDRLGAARPGRGAGAPTALPSVWPLPRRRPGAGRPAERKEGRGLYEPSLAEGPGEGPPVPG